MKTPTSPHGKGQIELRKLDSLSVPFRMKTMIHTMRSLTLRYLSISLRMKTTFGKKNVMVLIVTFSSFEDENTKGIKRN